MNIDPFSGEPILVVREDNLLYEYCASVLI